MVNKETLVVKTIWHYRRLHKLLCDLLLLAVLKIVMKNKILFFKEVLVFQQIICMFVCFQQYSCNGIQDNKYQKNFPFNYISQSRNQPKSSFLIATAHSDRTGHHRHSRHEGAAKHIHSLPKQLVVVLLHNLLTNKTNK